MHVTTCSHAPSAPACVLVVLPQNELDLQSQTREWLGDVLRSPLRWPIKEEILCKCSSGALRMGGDPELGPPIGDMDEVRGWVSVWVYHHCPAILGVLGWASLRVVVGTRLGVTGGGFLWS